jgi:phage FluMu protein Com
MQIRCYHCNRPFALKKEVVHAALDMITSENLSHYDAHCPHCRRVNRVSRQELLRAAPDWEPQNEAKEADG